MPSERVEEARGLLAEFFPDGFEEEEEIDGRVVLAGYTSSAPDERLVTLGDVSVQRVAPGWEDAWKRFHRPGRVGELWVGPPWERPDDDAIAVVIDPGRAFGTGAHPTTRLGLELLLACERGSLVDLGCGSGVVAIAAARLGFEPVVALDSDPAAIEATLANARANGVRIDARCVDALVERLPEADVAVANITFDIVERLFDRARADALVTSGYLASEHPRSQGWRHVERRELDGWAADYFETSRKAPRRG